MKSIENREIVDFKGTQIPQFEADVLQKLENHLDKQINLVNKFEYNTEIGFTVENQRITGIGLNRCNVSTLPESIVNLTSLKELHLGSNQLTIIPESVLKIISLKGLYLPDNKLTTIPE